MMNDYSIMPFGKYKGVKLIDIPCEYLLYIDTQPWCKGELKEYLKENLQVLYEENKRKQKAVSTNFN